MLAISSANQDIATSDAIKLSRELDANQGSQYRTGGYTGLANGTVYFGYWSIPMYRFGFTTK